MELIFWLAVAWFIGRRWLRKHPEKAALLKDVLHELHAGREDSAKHNLVSLLAHRSKAAKPGTTKPAIPAPHQASRGTLHHVGAAKPQPPLTQRKKQEKQFEQL